ncbi:MAG TPA: hypothetical protein VMY42_21850 [Thermoguttaceae bacterium]|nr:hypothetical protein [Thermoguttaceae bacterium]
MPDAAAFHKWEPRGILKHFAYLLAEDKRFTEADAEFVVRRLIVSQTWTASVLRELSNDEHVLECEHLIRETLWSFLGMRPATYIVQYYMPKGVRVEYETQLKSTEGDSEPERKAVSKSLESLAVKVVEPQQEAFLNETLKCLKADANRAAIVMAWNLSYDHIRRWVCKNHLHTFNNELTCRYRRKGKTYDAVTSADDFPDSEWLVLDVCRVAKIINKRKMDVLEPALRTRNQFAHPSPARANAPMAAGYIANLLENVVLDPLFFEPYRCCSASHCAQTAGGRLQSEHGKVPIEGGPGK